MKLGIQLFCTCDALGIRPFGGGIVKKYYPNRSAGKNVLLYKCINAHIYGYEKNTEWQNTFTRYRLSERERQT